jgi:exonuclease III
VTRLRLLGLITVSVACACADDFIQADSAADTAVDVIDAGAADTFVDTGRPPIPEGALTVGTWNIEQLPKTTFTIDSVAAVVMEERIDLLGVQEIVERADFDALAAAMPGYQPIVTFDSAPIRVGFLYRVDRLEVTEIERLFTGDFWAFPRPILKARVLDLETGFDFIFLVLHLKAQIDEESRVRRVLAIRAIDEWLEEQLRTGTEQDFIVLGDYNDELTDRGEQNVFIPLLDAPERYHFLTLAAEEAGQYTYLPFDAMIDHIMVTTDALDEYGSGTTEILRLEDRIMYYEARVSDHRPVIARFVP